MNTADNQTQNLNYNPYNPNLTNPGSKKVARDYDKEPLVIKDELSNAKFLSIIFLVLCIVALVVRKQFFSQYDMAYSNSGSLFAIPFLTYMTLKNTIRNFEKNAQIYFYDSYIVKRLENGVEKRILISEIKDITKSISSMLPNSFVGKKAEKAILFIASLFFLLLLALLIYRGKFIIIASAIVFTFMVLYLPQLIIHSKHSGLKNNVYDVLWLQDKDGKFFNFMISSDKQYNDIKGYLLAKTGKSLDKADKKLFLSISWFRDKKLLD